MSILAEPETEEDFNSLIGAKNFLFEFLSDGPKDWTTVKREAKVAGISERTLVRAKDMLAVKAKRFGSGKDGKWEWVLPKTAAPESKPANSQRVAALDQAPETNC